MFICHSISKARFFQVHASVKFLEGEYSGVNMHCSGNAEKILGEKKTFINWK